MDMSCEERLFKFHGIGWPTEEERIQRDLALDNSHNPHYDDPTCLCVSMIWPDEKERYRRVAAMRDAEHAALEAWSLENLPQDDSSDEEEEPVQDYLDAKEHPRPESRKSTVQFQ